MSSKQAQAYSGIVSGIIADTYNGLNNKGLVSDHIPAGLHTTDFELPNSLTVRIKEEKQSVYYTIFRAK